MKELSPKERCFKVLNGEIPDRVPVIPQKQIILLRAKELS